MIGSLQDYKAYLKADCKSMGIEDTLVRRLFDARWDYVRTLRRLEYLTNCRKSQILRAYFRLRLLQKGTKIGYSIPINVFGPGLALPHRGDIIVNDKAKIGKNCRVHVGVNIGTQAGPISKVPTIGDNCYIGPGAKLFGDIVIGNNTTIAANAVVNKSYPDGNCTLGGIPARVISQKNSAEYLTQGWVDE
ncbi:serine O-acetyltransferase [Massilia sp. DWR3-1-1]|uniref:serine O-acetyltransferase n=1 Tax=Massilia sp. DWR3-1-1 TaxID=2804559 RepID=UPI003CEB3E1F